ncbi:MULTISPECIES: VIT1/CCC1 transporter family protein [Thermoanaerobacterium]|uniref:Rubrerythrin diiron-binding domain-containing protein n=2 Tax=Thermoanaerobacterium TaxID=28895 RepID=W9E9I3_9THEO|nr:MULTISPECIES: VIT1/CCC1 transporter family protein [Thermoanaerobacterium]AFK85089.1 protein of unknown function DUF125 transmembrane [Thermoanaerobacterium saccharolyticum JW/SL-YS485]ETO37515.1 hypothetical protein V518_2358 [Thermoanaerobacterium aotearoense SCUT27]
MQAIEKAKKFYYDELNAKQLYSYLAKVESKKEVKELFEELSKIEANHTKYWYDFLSDRGVKLKPKVRAKSLWFYKILRTLLGSRLFIILLEMQESNSTDEYYEYYKDPILTESERQGLALIIEDELEHEKNLGNQNKEANFSNIRDFILGMNDGLVEILGTVTGLSAVYQSKPLIVGASGLVVGIAGALSMAIGAYTSVRSQRQVNEGIKSKMELLFNVSKNRAKEELLNKLSESGIPDDISQEIVEKLGDNENAMANLLVEEVKENEIKSALYTGLAYLVGLFFPVIPYFFITSSSVLALILSVIFAAIALSIVGMVVSIASESLSIKNKIIEMVLSGLGAAALSYLFGTFVQFVFGINA